MYRGLNRKLPLVLIDADGVLKLGYERIKAGTYAINTLRKFAIPFQIVTNGGGGTDHRLFPLLYFGRLLFCHLQFV